MTSTRGFSCSNSATPSLIIIWKILIFIHHLSFYANASMDKLWLTRFGRIRGPTRFRCLARSFRSRGPSSGWQIIFSFRCTALSS